MSYAVQIKFADAATPAIRALSQATKPAAINQIIGRSGRNSIRDYLFSLDSQRPNQLGGPRTHFYGSAARATQFQVVESGVVISINQIGIAQRYYGGVIKPVKTKYLTIPIAPEAHGKTVADFGDLQVIFGKNRQPVALATKAGSGKSAAAKASKFGVVLFLLVKSVNQTGDETVLPKDEKLISDINKDVTAYLNREIARAGGKTP